MITKEEIALSDRVNIICGAWRRLLKVELPQEAASTWIKQYGFRETLRASQYVFSRYKDKKRRIESPIPYVAAILRSENP